MRKTCLNPPIFLLLLLAQIFLSSCIIFQAAPSTPVPWETEVIFNENIRLVQQTIVEVLAEEFKKSGVEIIDRWKGKKIFIEDKRKNIKIFLIDQNDNKTKAIMILKRIDDKKFVQLVEERLQEKRNASGNEDSRIIDE